MGDMEYGLDVLIHVSPCGGLACKDVPGREREVGRAGPVWSTAQGSGLQVGLRVREAGRIRPSRAFNIKSKV